MELIMRSHLIRPLALTLALASTLAAPGQAQLGGLVKKAKSAIAGSDTPAATAVAKATPTGPVTVKPAHRIDAASLDLFAQALAAEKTWLEDRARIRKTLRTKDDFRQCAQVAVATSPEGQKLTQMYLDAIESKENDGSVAFMTKVAEKLQAEQEKIVFANCGYDPDKYGPEPGPAALYQPSEHEAAKKVGMEHPRYAILKERITPFCAMDPAERGGGDVRVRGDGNGVFYVYEASEAALLAPRCDALLKAIKAVS
jgi:hypothetical protein